MNLDFEDYKQPLRNLADDLIEERQATSAKEPLGHVLQYLDALKECIKTGGGVVTEIEHLTIKLVLLASLVLGLGSLLVFEARRGNSWGATNIPEVELKSDPVVPKSFVTLTNERSIISNNLTTSSLESKSSTRKKKSQHPLLTRTIHSTTGPLLAEDHSRQSIPPATFPIGVPFRYENGRWRSQMENQSSFRRSW